MQLSIVIPSYNEEESIPHLQKWIEKVMQENDFSYEVIYIDDGSKDDTWEEISKLASKNKHIKAIKFQRNYGKAAALQKGFEKAQGDVVITMDADLQDSPDEIPALYKMITKDNYDLVSGWKQKRYDPITKTVPTKVYNGVTRAMSGIKLHDMNCGLKAYKNEVVKSVEVYGDMHRYIPVLAKQAGFDKIGEKVVKHQARKYGTTKFGLERFINGPLDLMSVMFMTRFGKRPMHVFGYLGGLMFLIGFIFTLWVLVQKALFVFWKIGIKPPLVTDNVIFYLALVAMVMGVQLFLAGFLGELVARTSPDRNDYLIEKEI
ncbi:MAG: glycosyltransferase family 2 protein [Bacteroidetes bacterium]|nr:glycosyltransferase family 2 protein [Bacteroidota bacterium]MCB9227874.1 glycosyltransferase family 2 protein [Chitinophagales bacterium]